MKAQKTLLTIWNCLPLLAGTVFASRSHTHRWNYPVGCYKFNMCYQLRQNWLTLSKQWCKVDTDDTTKHEDLNLVFATHGEEDEIYPLTIIEIAEAQKKDRNIKIYYKRNAKTPEKGMRFQLIENTKVPF